ncbi:MAG: 16S rRNA (cytosine(1402)-N(4))-methyltransferase RsmH [Firmicutes bacterium]|nr:16S rRNA (cytosine(1402)-N(4))-methyltransferase RsmH [Bacillota bacterium]
MEFYHQPVMLKEVINWLKIEPAGVYVDCTTGGGGHSWEILRRLGRNGRLIGLDQDAAALTAARQKLADERVTLVQTNFARIKEVLEELGIGAINGVLFDLGMSSYQIDEGERGFSFQQDAPLDMRMNPEDGPSAAELVNKLSVQDLTRLITNYGEERWAKRIAEFIVARRKYKPILTTGELVGVIKAAIPAAARRTGPHPARRTFQALRIAVNDEIGVLERALNDSIQLLQSGGRIVVISFHSLEDRLVKQVFQAGAQMCICPPGLPVCTCHRQPLLKVLTRKPVVPSAEEVEKNPRSRSAKMRVAERI